MNLSTLKPNEGSTKKVKRIGRGEGSGHGGTSTRGHKGAGSRSGHSTKPGFEGGQMPLYRRVPKFGFNNPNKVYFKGINLDTLQELSKKESEITFDVLYANGLVSKNDKVKVLGRGELTAKVNVTVHAFSEAAKNSIEKAGGTANTIS
jgi:large subunit ribosomal protein L15